MRGRLFFSHSPFSFLSVSTIIHNTFRFSPGFRGSAREVRRWWLIPRSCCIVGAPWLLWGQNPSLAQGCHLLVDLSCNSDMYFMRIRRRKAEEGGRLLYFISITSCLNKSVRLLPPKKEKRQAAQTTRLVGIWEFDRKKYSDNKRAMLSWLGKWNQQSAISQTKGFLKRWTPKLVFTSEEIV